jgi:hypothetical protein
MQVIEVEEVLMCSVCKNEVIVLFTDAQCYACRLKELDKIIKKARAIWHKANPMHLPAAVKEACAVLAEARIK